MATIIGRAGLIRLRSGGCLCCRSPLLLKTTLLTTITTTRSSRGRGGTFRLMILPQRSGGWTGSSRSVLPAQAVRKLLAQRFSLFLLPTLRFAASGCGASLVMSRWVLLSPRATAWLCSLVLFLLVRRVLLEATALQARQGRRVRVAAQGRRVRQALRARQAAQEAPREPQAPRGLRGRQVALAEPQEPQELLGRPVRPERLVLWVRQGRPGLQGRQALRVLLVGLQGQQDRVGRPGRPGRRVRQARPGLG